VKWSQIRGTGEEWRPSARQGVSKGKRNWRHLHSLSTAAKKSNKKLDLATYEIEGESTCGKKPLIERFDSTGPSSSSTERSSRPEENRAMFLNESRSPTGCEKNKRAMPNPITACQAIRKKGEKGYLIQNMQKETEKDQASKHYRVEAVPPYHLVIQE